MIIYPFLQADDVEENSNAVEVNENEIIENCKSDGDHGSEIESDEKKNESEVEVAVKDVVNEKDKAAKHLKGDILFFSDDVEYFEKSYS